MPDVPHYTDITADSTLRQLFNAAAAECTSGEGVKFESTCLVNGTLYRHRLHVQVLATPNAGSDPAVKH